MKRRNGSAPIDAVFTWVSNADLEWQKRRERALIASSPSLSRNATSTARWHDKEELRYALRSVWKNAPWIRHVYIVTDAQIPRWLDIKHPKITIVDHRDIFPEARCLPVFNSHAIEACLHNTKGLSEHFIYLNDDILFCREVGQVEFFADDGRPILYAKKSAKVPDPSVFLPEDVRVYDAAAMNARALIMQETGHDCERRLCHAPFALRRSHLREMEDVFGEALARTRCATFRSSSDVPLPSFMYPWYGWTRGWVEIRILERTNDVVGSIPLARWSFMRKAMKVFANRPMFLNINDSENGSVPIWLRRIIVSKLVGRLFPLPAPWELDKV